MHAFLLFLCLNRIHGLLCSASSSDRDNGMEKPIAEGLISKERAQRQLQKRYSEQKKKRRLEIEEGKREERQGNQHCKIYIFLSFRSNTYAECNFEGKRCKNETLRKFVFAFWMQLLFKCSQERDNLHHDFHSLWPMLKTTKEYILIKL